MDWIKLTTPETYPKSGVPVIVFVENVYGEKTRTLRAQYAAPKTLELADDQEPCGEDCYDEETDTYYCPEGWYETNEFEEINWRIHGDVTHWTPLPDSPKKNIEQYQ